MRRKSVTLQKRLVSAASTPTNRICGVTTRVLPGELRTTGNSKESLVTVLGSCISACVRNPVTGFGGMNHFMLPESETGDWNGADSGGRYGNLAMDALIADIAGAGCPMANLEVKVFGGADLYRGSILVGSRNVEFLVSYLQKRRLTPFVQDIGGTLARKIIYTPSTGRVLRQFIKPHSDDEIVQLEQRYQAALRRNAARPPATMTRKV